jgi:hypothetical protein
MASKLLHDARSIVDPKGSLVDNFGIANVINRLGGFLIISRKFDLALRKES